MKLRSNANRSQGEAPRAVRALVRIASVGAACALALAAASGCHQGVRYDAYSGDAAYPDRRAPLPAASGVLGLTTDNGSDTISALDLPAATLLATVPVGRDPVDLDGPHHLAIDRSGAVYVAYAYPVPAFSPGPHSAHASSRRAGYAVKLAADDLRPLGEVRVDPNPGDIVLSEDGSRLVVTHFDLQKATDASLPNDQRLATLALIDASRMEDSRASATLIPICLAPHGVALSRPDGATAFVACYAEDTIAVVHLDDPSQPVVRVPLGATASSGSPLLGPYSAVLSPSGKRLAIGDTESKDVRFFDTATLKVVGPVIGLQGAPYFAAWSRDESVVFIPTQGQGGDEVIAVRTDSGDLVARRSFAGNACVRPHEIQMSSDGARLYVVCEGDHIGPGAVVVLDSSTLDTIARTEVGVYPDRIALRGEP